MGAEFPCPGCGAELKWKPGADSLECPYCGTSAFEPSDDRAPEGEIVEYRLEEAAANSETGYGTATISKQCEVCAAVADHEPELEATECPFCGSTQLLDGGDDRLIRPESVLPFEVNKADASRQFRAWLSGLWFRPSALKKQAQLEGIVGVYIPCWTFDADARSAWTADAGYRYQVEEPYTATENGEQVSKTRTVTKTRWEDASGKHEQHYDDWLVQASKGLDQKAIKGMLPFKLAKLRPYDVRFLAGFRAERYCLDLPSAWGAGQKELHAQETRACRRLVPGDTQRKLRVNTSFSEVRFKHTLLPVWVAAYRFEGKVYRYLVNGESGKQTGDAPISKWKVFFFILSIVMAMALCFGGVSLVGAAGALISGS
jgi:hypothetical protein